MPASTSYPARPQPCHHEPREVAPADSRTVLAALSTGVALDLAAHRHVASVATSAVVIVVGVGLVLSGRLPSRQSRLLVLGAAVFGLWVTIRTSPWLVPLDLLAATALLVLATSVSVQGRILGQGLRDLARQLPGMVRALFGAVPFLSRALAGFGGAARREQAGALGLGLALAAPIVAVLLALLASGDALTSATLGSLAGTGVIDHVFVTIVGLVAGAALLFRAACPDDEPVADSRRFLGVTETVVILSCVAAVFLGFTVLQVAGALGAADHVLESAAETSRWAREGFFQLLWASGITLAVLLVLDAVTERPNSRANRFLGRLSAATALLALCVVASATLRIVEYSQTFGLTMLRLYSGLFAAWIGVVFVFHGLRAFHPQRWGRWFATGSAAAGLAILLGLNVANPEALVVQFDTTDPARADAAYLGRDLSEDAVPSLIASLESLEPSVARQITEELCRHPAPSADGWLSWNWSRARARDALQEFC